MNEIKSARDFFRVYVMTAWTWLSFARNNEASEKKSLTSLIFMFMSLVAIDSIKISNG